MMFNYPKLQDRYQSDPGFNKAVNLFRQLIDTYGFTPHELREGMFLAQYMYEMDHVQRFVRSQQEIDQAAVELIRLRTNFIIDAEGIIKNISDKHEFYIKERE